jgi:hypothetical protein
MLQRKQEKMAGMKKQQKRQYGSATEQKTIPIVWYRTNENG